MILSPFPFIALLVSDSGEHCIKVLLPGMGVFCINLETMQGKEGGPGISINLAACLSIRQDT